jgi:MFS family permease
MCSDMATGRITTPAQVEQPTHKRNWVIVFAVTLAILAYIDRVCISMAAPDMSRDLGMDKVQMGTVFSAFGLAYALFEIPGGWLGDWMGPRRVLLRIVAWWSTFTALTGWAWSLSSLWVIRFLFGAGEAGCFPNLTKAFTVWLPSAERVRAQGIMWTFARWGGAFTPPLVVLVFRFMSWRWAFVLFGSIGLLWGAFFYLWFRDDPKDHKGVNKAELALIKASGHAPSGHGNVPWGKLARSRTVWMLWVQYFCLSFPWYFYITWLPTYLQEDRHLDPTTTGTYAILPLAVLRIHLALRDPMDRQCHGEPPLDRLHRIPGSIAAAGCLDQSGSRLPGHDRDGPSELLQRSGHAGRLGSLHGRRRQIRRNSFRIDEHDGEHGRIRRARDGWIHPRADRRRLEHLPLCDGRRLPDRNHLLAAH